MVVVTCMILQLNSSTECKMAGKIKRLNNICHAILLTIYFSSIPK